MLFRSVTPDIKSTIMYCDTAQEAYERLKLRYAEPSDIRSFQLEQDLNAVVQNNMTVGEYFTKLNSLWEELKHYQPSPHCKCGKCECKLHEEFQVVQDKRKVFKFLMSLNSSYDFIRAKVISQDPLPNLDKTYYMVLQEERQKQTRSYPPSQEDASAFAVNFKKKEKLFCTNCEMTNHNVEQCYRIDRKSVV